MFHSAALKLTGWYLLIIMALSIGFSAVIYRVSSTDLARDAGSQIAYFNGFLGPEDLEHYSDLRRAQLAADQQHIKNRLIIFNLIVLAGGGLISYGLARRTLEPIEQSLEAQKRFAADASHELRTPLAAIQAEIEVALRAQKLTPRAARQLLESNLEEVAKLKSLSDGLLRLTGNGKDIRMRPVILKDAVKAALERQAKPAAAKDIKLVSSVKNHLVQGDPDNLAELISILVDNAIKYSPSGSRVRLTSSARGKTVRLNVADQGIGIAASDLPRIFERFYRADSSRSKNSAGGYGLGLALARQLADLQGAAIEVKSAPNKGSTFSLCLPAV